MLSAQNIKELEEKGYTVVPGVISPEECDKYIEQYNQWLTTFKGKWPKSYKGILRGYNTGHLETTWNIRLKTKTVFSQLWKTEKLMTSFDSIAIGRPPEDGKEPFDDGSTHWLHLDQEATREGLHAYQGGVYLEEACEDDWTLQVMKKSHMVFQKFFNEKETAAKKSIQNQFFKLSKTQVRYFEQNGCTIKRLPVPKGGMALWDSRVVHANAQPKEGRTNPGRWRYVVFVSMTPARWASDADIAIKRDAYKGAKMTNHWSSEGSMLMKKSSANKSRPENLPSVAKTEEGRRLAGVMPYNFDDEKPNGPPKPVTRMAVKRKIDEVE